jgi:hypothetical protein
MDPALMDFAHLQATGRIDADGDHAFDAENFPAPAFSEDEDESGAIEASTEELQERIIVRSHPKTADA